MAEAVAFGSALRSVASSMPDALIGAEAVERLVQCASALPASAGQSMFGFEMRLDGNAPLCDFFLDVPPDSPLGADLVERGRSGRASPTDRSLGRLLQDRQQSESFLSRWFERIILEYDLIEGGHRGRFQPGLFLTPAHEDGRELPDIGAPTQLAGPEVLVAALCSAAGWPHDRRELRKVSEVLDLMPGNARLKHVGALPIRTPRAVRLLLNMQPDDVAAYLDRIGWAGHRESVVHTLSLASSGFARTVVGLDVTGGTVSSRIGFELHMDGPWWTVTPDAHRDFVELCVAEGWCLPGKAKGLGLWPRRETLVDTHRIVRFFSGLNHFKLTVDGPTVSVKAYTGATFLFPETGPSR